MLLGVGGALLASALVLFLLTSSWVVALAYGAGLGVLLFGMFTFERMLSQPQAAEVANHDWSVTVAAIEQPGEAVAITDRANRLVCANSAFIEAFGATSAPPSLPFERAGLEATSAWLAKPGAMAKARSRR